MGALKIIHAVLVLFLILSNYEADFHVLLFPAFAVGVDIIYLSIPLLGPSIMEAKIGWGFFGFQGVFCAATCLAGVTFRFPSWFPIFLGLQILYCGLPFWYWLYHYCVFAEDVDREV